MSQEITNALLVIVLTQHIREYLELYDPQALKQAVEALTASDPEFPARLAGTGEYTRPEAGYAEYTRRADQAIGRDSLTRAIHYWDGIGQEIGAKSRWSLYNESGTNADAVGIEGRGLTLVYTGHWGPTSASIDLPDNPTWKQLFVAADKLIRDSGDNHHTFIELFQRCGDSTTYELITGS
jgi:hypothetical protein